MSAETPSTPPEAVQHTLPQPIDTHPERIVEDVYLLQRDDEPAPDVLTRDRMEDFLVERYRPDSVSRPGGKVRIVTGTEEKWRGWERRKGEWSFWGFGDKVRFWTAMAALNVTVFLGLNGERIKQHMRDGADKAGDTAKNLGGKVDDLWSENRSEADDSAVVSIRMRAEREVRQLNASGDDVPDPKVVESLLDRVKELRRDGFTVDAITVEGRTSDEWLSKDDQGLGHGDRENRQLGKSRAERFAAIIEDEAKLRNIKLRVKTSEEERVLSRQELADFRRQIDNQGLEDLGQALEAYALDPRSVPPEVAFEIEQRLDIFRGVVARIDSSRTIRVPRERTEPEAAPEQDPEKDPWKLIPLTLLPLPLFRKRFVEKLQYLDVEVPDTVANPEYVKLYPQALEQDSDRLVAESWSYARKYQNLLRETERIQHVARMDYEDADGEPRRLRAMFVDHQPTEETLQIIEGMMTKLSQAQDGRLGTELDMIVIYPTENAGRHGDYKKVGIGLDVQEHQGVLGTAYMSLGLVEMWMPPEPTEEELRSYMGAEWILAHEAGGHMTDLNEEENRLVELASGEVFRVFTLTPRLNGTARADYVRSMNELHEDPEGEDLEWQVQRGVQQLDGTVERVTQHITGTEDSRLEEARHLRKGGIISQYGTTDDLLDPDGAEHYAESGANVITGIPVPFTSAPETGVHSIANREGYADGHHASPEMHNLITTRLGGDPESDTLRFATERATAGTRTFSHGSLEDDAELAEAAREARNTSLPPEDELLHIITDRRFTGDPSVREEA